MPEGPGEDEEGAWVADHWEELLEEEAEEEDNEDGDDRGGEALSCE